MNFGVVRRDAREVRGDGVGVRAGFAPRGGGGVRGLPRAGIASVTTMANPEKIAPATKYGGKIVVCHPGS